MNKLMITALSASAILIFNHSFASERTHNAPFKILPKPIDVTLKTHTNKKSLSEKQVKLMQIKLDDDYKSTIAKRMKELDIKRKSLSYKKSLSKQKSLPAVNLGMSGVPVLDQGRYGTCTIFATTAFLDAKYFPKLGENKNGDFISQQCYLEFHHSAWDSGYPPVVVLEKLKKHGAVSKASCHEHYPNKSVVLPEKQYQTLGQQSQGDKIINAYMIDDYSNKQDGKMKDRVINILNSGNRALIAVILDGDNAAGAPIDGYPNGLWRLNPGQTLAEFCGETTCAGHALIVTGYDPEKKLFTIRNSWGTSVGVKGEYYMGLDYLDILTMSATNINERV